MATTFQIGGSEAWWTPRSKGEVLRSMRRSLDGSFTDTTFEGRFEGKSAGISYRGTLVSTDRGTLVEVRREVNVTLVIVGLAIFFVAGPLFAAILAFVIYQNHAKGETRWRAVKDDLGVTLEGQEARDQLRGHEVADPSADGAAAGAPLSLVVQTDLDGAIFQARSRSGAQVWIQVHAQGLTVRREGAGATVRWDDVRMADLRGNHLVIVRDDAGDALRVDMSAHPEEDRLWLAVYVQSRNDRYSATHEERAAAEAHLQPLRGRDRA